MKKKVFYFLREYWFLLVLLAIVFSIMLAKWSSLTVSDRVLLLTLAAIFWYTWETYLLRLETAWATTLANRPFVSIQELRDVSQPGEMMKPYRIVFENMGKGCAINLTLVISNADGVVQWSKKALSIGSEKTAEFMDGMFDTYLHGFQEGKFILKIVYDDLAGKQYYSSFEFDGKANLKFLDSGAD